MGTTLLTKKGLKWFGKDILRAAYRGIVGRQPRDEELDLHAQTLEQTGQLRTVLQSIAQSEEAWKRNLLAQPRELVRQLHQAIVGREPTNEECDALSHELIGSQDLARTVTQMLASRQQAQRRIELEAERLVHATFQALLGRPAEPGALESYADMLVSTSDVEGFLAQVAQSDEHAQKLGQRSTGGTPASVVTVFEVLLERRVNSEEQALLADALATGASLESIIREIVGSEEFGMRQMRHPARCRELSKVLCRALVGPDVDEGTIEREAASLESGMGIEATVGRLAPLAPARAGAGFDDPAIAAKLLQAAYLGLLGREPDAAGVAGYSDHLARHGSPVDVFKSMIESTEHWDKQLALRAPQLVDLLHRALLGRPADAETIQAYEHRLRDSLGLLSVISELGSSREHRERILREIIAKTRKDVPVR